MSNDILHGNDAKEKILAGINKVADTVKPTLGPKARTVVLEQRTTFPMILNDGVKIAGAIHDEDPFVNMGVGLIQQVAREAQGGAGDGTTTAIVIAQALANNGMQMIREGADPVQLKLEIEEAAEQVIDYLQDIAVDVDSNDLVDVATIAANNDSTLGNLISDVFREVGSQGVVTMERGHTTQTEYQLTEGVQIERGFLSPVMVTNHETGMFDAESPLILISNHTISNFHELVPALEASIESGRPLLIIAKDLQGNALPNLFVNIAQGQLRACFVRAVGWGDDLDHGLRDLAALTGARMIDSTMNMQLKDITKDDLGTCVKALVDQRKTVLVHEMNDEQANVFTTYVSDLKSQADATTEDWDKEKILSRIAALTGGVAVIRVGAATEVELAETMERIDDALNATKAALEAGIIPGGGAALFHATELGDSAGNFYVSGKMTDGDRLVGGAIVEPAITIARNAGHELDFSIMCEDSSSGYNAVIGDYEDLLAAGIVDPLKVTISALRSAVSIASLVLMTEAAVPLKSEVLTE